MAYQSNNLGLVDTIVSNYRTSRKRKMVNRPQNLTTSKKKKRNQQKLLSRNRDEIIVDSTSSDVNKVRCFCLLGILNVRFDDCIMNVECADFEIL